MGVSVYTVGGSAASPNLLHIQLWAGYWIAQRTARPVLSVSGYQGVNPSVYSPVINALNTQKPPQRLNTRIVYTGMYPTKENAYFILISILE